MSKLARHVSLRQLQIFSKVVELNSITGAGESLHLTQPTVSTQLKTLSDAVGARLLQQNGRKLSLTDAGRVIHEATQEIFAALERAEQRVADLNGMTKGTLRISVITSAKYFIPEVLGKFAEQYPDVDVSMTVAKRETVLQRLNEHEDELCIFGYDPPPGVNVEAISFAPSPLFVVAHEQHPLVNERNISLARIAQEPFIAREAGSGTRDGTEQCMAKQGLQPNICLELNSNEAIKNAVMEKQGIAVLSLHSIAFEKGPGPLAILDVEGFPLQRQWQVMYPSSSELSPLAREFIALLKEQGEQMSQQLIDASPKAPSQRKSRQREKRAAQ